MLAFAQGVDKEKKVDQGQLERSLDNGEFPPVVAQYQSAQKTGSEEYTHSQLNNWANVSTAEKTLTITSDPLPHQCIDCEVVEAKVKVEFRMGADDYTYGRVPFSSSISVEVQGWGDNGSGTLVQKTSYGPCALAIDETTPQQRCVVDFLADHADITEFRVVVVNGTYIPPTNLGYAGTLQQDIRLQVFYEERFSAGAVHMDPLQADQQLVEVNAIGNSGAGWTRVETNPLTFSWTLVDGCTDDQFPSYQLQLLRLFNREEEYVNSTNIASSGDGRLHDVVDWTKALTIETGSKELSQVLTIAEGTGYYVWRIRPIGDKYPGGIANDRNWGVWSAAPKQGAVVDIPDISGSATLTIDGQPEARSSTVDGIAMTGDFQKAIFFYGSFDEDKNWIYSRKFSEGDVDGTTGVRISEAISYATGLLRSRQSQAHMQTANQVILSESFHDYNGRPAVQTMAAPRPWVGFSYDATFIEGFTAASFDGDLTVPNPDPIPDVDDLVVSNELVDYYSSSQSTDLEKIIPDAQGYPYSRTIWYPDASGRVCEQGGPGQTHRIGGYDPNGPNGIGENHTSQFYYASAFESELIAMFGNEAPDPSSVRTIYTVDPNKVTMVSYVSKSGSTLATALVNTSGELQENRNKYLDDGLLGEQVYSGESITQIPGSLSGDAYHHSGRLMVESPGMDVTLTYRLTPEVLDLRPCPTVDFCETCDYELSITITNAKNPTDIVYDESIDVYQVIAERQLDFCNGSSGVIEITTNGTSDNLPVINQFQSIGAYIVDVRLQTNRRDPADPSGLARRYVDIWSNDLRDELRTSMDSRLTTLYTFLEEAIPDIEGFYDQLETWATAANNVERYDENGSLTTDVNKTVFYRLRGVNGDVNFPEETCWSIDIPVLGCEDGVTCDADSDGDIYDGNGDLDVDFEAMLYSKWGPGGYIYTDENGGTHNFGDTPEKYFRRDGEAFYPDEAPYNTNGGHGKGAFNDMIVAMIDDGYDCKALLTSWEALVNGFGVLATEEGSGDPTRLRKDFDLMETFLSMVGARFEGVSDCPYKTSGTPCSNGTGSKLGNRLYAYKYFEYAVGDEPECEENVRYNDLEDGVDGNGNPIDHGALATWGADDPTDDYADQLWLRLYNCVRGRERHDKLKELVDVGSFWCGDCDLTDPANYNCYVELRDSIQSRCTSICDARAEGFRRGIIKMYHDAGYPIEGEETMPDGSAIISGTTIISHFDVECKVEMLVERCKNDCSAPLLDDQGNILFTSGEVEQIGDSIHIAKMQQVYSASFKVALHEGGSCSDPSMEAVHDKGDVGKAIVRAMNKRLSWYRREVIDADTGTPESYFYYIRDSIYLKTMLESGYYDQTRETTCTTTFWDAWPDWGDGSGTVTEPEDDDYFDRDCCPPMAMPETFTFDEAIDGEFVLHEEWGPVDQDNYNYRTHLLYRRTCNRNGQEYVHEQLLCDEFVNCFTDVLIPQGTDQKGSSLQALSRYNDCACHDTLCFKWDNPTIADAVTVGPVFCEEALAEQLRAAIESQAATIIEGEAAALRSAYRERCLEGIDGALEIKKRTELYHFTLYYYDRAGNLVRTVPPAGVNLLSTGQTRQSGPISTANNHTLVTEYEYNSVGQLVNKETPDGGKTTYWYDDIGRVRLSQDAQQLGNGQVSYTRFDNLSRRVEIGEATEPTPLSGETQEDALRRSANDELFPDASNCEERVYTSYSWAYTTTNPNDVGYLSDNEEYIDGSLQRYTLNRIAHVYTDDGVHTQYSYDPHGNVEWIRQEIPGLGSNYVRYEYDLISAKVLGMSYNEGWVDQYFHCYTYDEDNRLLQVKTSRDGEIWDRDAEYFYYDHGPVRRVEYGEDNLQGVDYVYTIHGWLKGVNHPAMSNNWLLDPGHDGGGSSSDEYAYDAFGMILTYYSGDFTKGVYNSTPGSSPQQIKKYNLIPTKHLYNGNISSWTTNTQSVGSLPSYWPSIVPALPPPPQKVYEQLTGYTFEYDVLNRLLTADFQLYNSGGNPTTGWWTEPQGYDASYVYDPNGNLKSLVRKGVGTDAYTGAPSANMDAFIYHYNAGTNRLNYVTDDVNYTANYQVDVDNQNANNYQYDATGNLIIDVAEGMTGASGDEIQWSVAGKIKSVTKNVGGGQFQNIVYTYDAAGNRVKKWFDPGNGETPKTTFYVYEAGGKVVAIYEEDCDPPGMIELDYDHDGVPDIADNCPMVWNPDQRDTDANHPLLARRDGVGDACDTDDDGDLTLDWNDPCPYDWNDGCIGLNDMDGDGIPDFSDPCPTYPNSSTSWWTLPNQDATHPINPDNIPDECDPDIDGDGINNDHDNCPYVANPDQTDTDMDGIGDACDCTPRLSEWLIYGSSGDGRIATVKPEGGIRRTVPKAEDVVVGSPAIYTRTVGEKEYELNDHLGNVRVVIADRKEGATQAGQAPFIVELRAYNNYYPFGMLQPEREFATPGYRYGFNGMEKVDEISGTGNSYTSHYRDYSPRLAKWLSVDPKLEDAPWHSPYQGFGNNPILFRDPRGDREWISLRAYQISTGKKELGKYDWLASDRKNKTNRWWTVMWAITEDKKLGEFEKFNQVRDYYIAVDAWLSKTEHETRWVKGALWLVSDLADAYNDGFTSGSFSSSEVRDLLQDLNLGIADFAITKFHDLLMGKFKDSPLKGDAAYNWDLEFVKHEQSVVAYPIYNKASSSALASLNRAFNGEGEEGFGSWLFNYRVPNVGGFGINLTDKNSRYGEQGRIDVPMAMLWPDRHRPAIKMLADGLLVDDEEYKNRKLWSKTWKQWNSLRRARQIYLDFHEYNKQLMNADY